MIIQNHVAVWNTKLQHKIENKKINKEVTKK